MVEYCYLTKVPDGLLIECSYDEDFLAYLKHHIPASERKWDPDMKQWWVSAECATKAASLARSHFDDVIDCGEAAK